MRITRHLSWYEDEKLCAPAIHFAPNSNTARNEIFFRNNLELHLFSKNFREKKSDSSESAGNFKVFHRMMANTCSFLHLKLHTHTWYSCGLLAAFYCLFFLSTSIVVKMMWKTFYLPKLCIGKMLMMVWYNCCHCCCWWFWFQFFRCCCCHFH